MKGGKGDLPFYEIRVMTVLLIRFFEFRLDNKGV